jgi:hypothetical protein
MWWRVNDMEKIIPSIPDEEIYEDEDDYEIEDDEENEDD